MQVNLFTALVWIMLLFATPVESEAAADRSVLAWSVQEISHCDELVCLPKSVLTNFVGTLSTAKVHDLNRALRIALDISD